jgi:hypothetical protein
LNQRWYKSLNKRKWGEGLWMYVLRLRSWTAMNMRPRSEFILNHMIGESFGALLSLPLAGIFCFLDAVRDFNHQVGVGQVGVVCSDFRHSFISCLFDFLLVAFFDVFVQRTATSLNFAEVFVVYNVLGAHITKNLLAY